MIVESIAGTAESMRREFDQTFARPAESVSTDSQDCLVVRAGEQSLVLFTADLRALLRCPRITAMSGRSAAFLGISAVRDAIVGMYCLSKLAGGPIRGTAGGWMALCGDGSVGLVFDELQSYRRVETHLFQQDHRAGSTEIIHGLLEIAGSTLPVLDMTNLLDQIGVGLARPDNKE
jgi:chemotaxis signal transduction protein